MTANLHLVTGYANAEHITSDDQGSFNAAILGEGAYVLDRGQKFAVEVISNTQIRIKDGDILLQGRHIRLNKNRTVDLPIEIGQQGKKRKDLIVVRYEKSRETEIEQANLVVIKGVSTTGTPQVPNHNQGNIINGDLIVDMPLYTVELNGLNLVGTPQKMFNNLLTVKSLQENATQRIEENINTIKSDIVKELEKKMNSKEVLTNLRTNNKTSLVAAINEVFQLGTNSANKIKSKVSALVGRNVANLTEVATEFEKYDVVELLEEKYKISKKNKKCFIMKNHLINGKEIFNLSNLEKVSLRTKVSNFSNYSNVIPTIENLDSDSIREIKLVDIASGNYMSSSEISNLIGHERYDSIGKIVKTIDDILILFKNYSGGNDFIFSFKKRRKYTQKSIYKLNEKYFTTYDSVYSLDTGTAIRTHRRRKDIDRFIENTNFGIKMVTALSIELVDVLNNTTIRTYNFNGQVEYIKSDVLESFNDIDYIYFAERNYGGDNNFNVYKLSVNGELTKIISQKNRETILEDFCISSKIDGNTIVTYRDSIIRVLQLDRILKKVR